MNQMPSSSPSKLSASLAGVGAGTFLIAIANNFPDSSSAKLWLTLAAPAVSVILGGGWLWIQVEVANYVLDRKVRLLVNRTRTQLQEALDDTLTSQKHRAAIRRKLEELELIMADRELRRIKSLTPFSAESLRETLGQSNADQ